MPTCGDFTTGKAQVWGAPTMSAGTATHTLAPWRESLRVRASACPRRRAVTATPRPYLDGRAVGSIACAGGWQAAAVTLTGLRAIVHALRGWPTPLGVALNTSEPVFGPDGALVDRAALGQLEILADQVVSFARRDTPGAGGRRHDDRLPLIRTSRPHAGTHPTRPPHAKEPT